jgi:AcrR family transcriptional regulator
MANMTSVSGQAKSKNPGIPGDKSAHDGARWRRRKEARPQEILDAALALFAQKGFAASRLDEIAARAGVSKGTIYLYFESKEAVFKALVQERLASRIGGFREVLRAYEGSSADLLTMLLRNFGNLISTSELVVLPKIVIAEAGNFPELARMYREEIVTRGLSLLGEIIERGIKRGEFRDIPSAHAARIAIGPLLTIAIWRTTFEKFDNEPYDYQGLVEAHIANLLQGLAKETA